MPKFLGIFRRQGGLTDPAQYAVPPQPVCIPLCVLPMGWGRYNMPVLRHISPFLGFGAYIHISGYV
jgi:hypothetical protein